MGSLAADVAAVCDAVGLEPAVVVGQSMGGIVGVHLAAQRPDLLRGVVLLDSPLLPPAAFGAMVPPLLEGMRSPDFRGVTRQFQGQFAGFADDPARREELLDRLSAGPQHVKVSTLEHVFGDDNETALRSVALPVLYVGSGAGLADIDRLRAACPQVEVAEVSGSGHFVQLEVPEQVNPLLQGFLSRLG
jgi:pimeloyl-ACP methyl ester carboxylesterase